MPRVARPFVSEPRPVPPDPVKFASDPVGLVEARRVYKRAYDRWTQRRRRAAARGETVNAEPMPMVPAQPVQSSMSGQMVLMIPANMLPASMMSLLATQ